MVGIKRVNDLHSLHGLTGNRCQELGNFINHNTIHAALDGAKKVMIETLYHNHLLDY